MNSKGVSPLIATVLLIAFTLSISGLIGGWLSGMTKTQTESLEKSSMETMNCTGSVISIFNVVCGNTTVDGPNKLMIAISNEGNNALYGFSSFAQIDTLQYINNTGGPTLEAPLYPGEHVILEYGCGNSCEDGKIVSKVRVSPTNCPTAWAEKLLQVTCV
ncbi:MAG: archaellin/type IV pilin N-terminal domain-containing protein [Candidatus Aenigmatarchaeota archaeon]